MKPPSPTDQTMAKIERMLAKVASLDVLSHRALSDSSTRKYDKQYKAARTRLLNYIRENLREE